MSTGRKRESTGEVPFHNAGHLCEVPPAGGGDAGGHGQCVPDVRAQKGRVLLQQGANPHQLRTLKEDLENLILARKISCVNELNCSTIPLAFLHLLPTISSNRNYFSPLNPWLFLYHMI